MRCHRYTTVIISNAVSAICYDRLSSRTPNSTWYASPITMVMQCGIANSSGPAVDSNSNHNYTAFTSRNHANPRFVWNQFAGWSIREFSKQWFWDRSPRDQMCLDGGYCLSTWVREHGSYLWVDILMSAGYRNEYWIYLDRDNSCFHWSPLTISR